MKIFCDALFALFFSCPQEYPSPVGEGLFSPSPHPHGYEELINLEKGYCNCHHKCDLNQSDSDFDVIDLVIITVIHPQKCVIIFLSIALLISVNEVKTTLLGTGYCLQHR